MLLLLSHIDRLEYTVGLMWKLTISDHEFLQLVRQYRNVFSEISQNYKIMNKKVALFFMFNLITFFVFPQKMVDNINRDPRKKDFANVFWNREYTLFDLLTDEPISPDKNRCYDIWYSSNEDPTPHHKLFSIDELIHFYFYKFKNEGNCVKWCDSKSGNDHLLDPDTYKKILLEKLDIYKGCYQRKDYIKMSSFVLPILIQDIGGVDKFVEQMKNLPHFFESKGMQVDMSASTFGEPEQFYKSGNSIISLVCTKLPISINNQKGFIESSIICFSKDEGATWFFIEGDNEGKSYIAATNPEIIQELDVPIPQIRINGKILYQKNGSWQH